MQKTISFKVKGMQRDLAVSAFNSEYAFENKNIRITSTNDNTLLSLVNEKGTKEVDINGIDSIEGIPIGQAIIDEELIIFTTEINTTDKENKDRIYKIWFEGEVINGKILFKGNLNFDYNNPIETLSFYENESIKKVYWVDGKNQPRVINIAATEEIVNKWNNNSFDFVQKINLQETISISRSLVSGGNFSPGIIQYAFTYFNKYGQESNIFNVSPLYYVSYNNRGASPEDKVSNSFNISVKDIDNSFDYLRIYSIHRTSINATPTIKRVTDMAIDQNNIINYTDNGLSGDIVDPTELLYIGGEEVVFGTIAQKDNTLFLGNIQLKRKILNDTIREYFKGKEISFSKETKSVEPPEAKGYYPYNNQLKLNSYQFKTFKYLEYYRFGIQAQHYTGKWSEPIWINDVKNTEHITTKFYNNSNIDIPIATFTLNDSSIINELYSNGYVRIRPVVVYPTINDREAVCQGVLCPTVYNVSDRYSNSPFAQSSWFVRPNVPFDVYKSFHYSQDSSTKEWSGDWNELNGSLEPSEYSRAGIMSNTRTIVNYNDNQYDIDIINKGAWLEFRHNHPIPNNNERNAEIQCIWDAPSEPVIRTSHNALDDTSWVSRNSENYYIDQSILTFHSPDIEFDNSVRSIDTSELKLRIVGLVPLTSFVSDIDIQTSTPVNNFYNSSELPIGFYKESIGVSNDFSKGPSSGESYLGDSHFGYRGLVSGAFWFDELTDYKKGTGNDNHYSTGFVVYPWHRNGSLNNTKFATDGYRSAMLDKKRMSNIRYSYKTAYLDSENIWKAYSEESDKKDINTGISGVSIFDSNEVSLIKLSAPKNSNLEDINYYGNIDKLLSISRIGDKKNGYPIIITGVQSTETNAHKLFSNNYLKLTDTYTEQITGVDPVRIKYKSTPHAVLALNYTKDNKQRILPTINDGSIGDLSTVWSVNSCEESIENNTHLFWDKEGKIKGVSQDVITDNIPVGPAIIPRSIQHGWLWLGELYNDNIQNRFGGQTEEAFENNIWLPCGNPVPLIDQNNELKNNIILKWEEGDTYYQRYDHIKTYPFTLEDQNQVTDIISFMCETRVNLDGRYDRNRGQTSNFAITPSNFNLMNDVYSQENNFFNYRTINPTKLNLDNFHNSITWTKTKTIGELTDTWTNITLASILDLDGDKGPVRSLRRLNNNLISFQDKGISQILYNENTQISTTEGIPIEIANSGKVTGKRYITDKIGCTNKWSICETPNGIYFIDDITRGIFLFNGQIDNLSDRLGFHTWINNNKSSYIWNPVNFNNFITYYDKVNKDVFFINKNSCLGYSELLNQFTSFYSYNNIPIFANIKDNGLWIKDNKLWLHHKGDYNMFFDTYHPFYTTVIANPNMQFDKVFNNLEFRSDSWDSEGNLLDTTFDTLTTWNEYQEGKLKLIDNHNKTSSLKRKFRIWRTIMPRDNSNGRDRMRNPWLYIKLSKEEYNTDKTILHDMMVYYFD